MKKRIQPRSTWDNKRYLLREIKAKMGGGEGGSALCRGEKGKRVPAGGGGGAMRGRAVRGVVGGVPGVGGGGGTGRG